MSTNTPSGADGPGAPPENPDGEAAEVLDAELVEEPASSPELPALGQVVSPVADEPETLELEPDPTGEVPAIAPSVRAPTPAPVRLPPVLPGMPRIAPRTAPPSAPTPPPTAPTWPTLDETIAAARERADKRAGSAGAAVLAALYEAELTALGPQSRARQATYAHELGELASQNSDEGGAVKAWARALQADPSLRPNLWAIRRAFERRAMWPNVLRLLDAELRFAQGAGERAELLIERGVVLEDRLADAAGSLTAFEGAAKEDPTAIRAFMALERRLVEDGTEPEKHRRVLGALAAATRDPGRRAALLIDLSRVEADAGVEGYPRARAALDEALALELGDGGRAAHYAGSGSPAALDELERLALRAGRPEWRMDALATRLRLLALDEIARPPGSTAEAERLAQGVVVRLRQAALAEEQGDAPAALGYLEAAQVLAADDPGSAPVVACELRIAAAASGRHEIAARLALAEAQHAPQSLRGALYLEAIDAFDRAGRSDEAVAAAAQAEAVGVGEAIEVRARRRAERVGDDEALLSGYLLAADRAAAADDGATAAAALAKAAVIAGEELGRHDDALAISERGWTLAPAGPLKDEHGDAIEWRLARLGRFEEWSAHLERRVSAEAPGPRRLALLERRAALLAERVGDLDGAMAALDELVAANPDSLRPRYELVGLARLAGDPGRAAVHLAEIIRRSSDDQRKAELELERGALLVAAGDAAAGEAAFRAALGASPGDGRATAALEELFERRQRAGESGAEGAPRPDRERAEALVAALRAELDANLSPERASALLSRLAELQEHERGDPKAAALAYQELFDRAAEPDEQAAALRGLARAFASLGNRDALIAALEREQELVTDGSARVLSRARIAWEKERRGELDAAEDDHQRLLDSEEDLTPELRAAARLGRLRAAYRSGAPAEAAAALGALVGLVDPELIGTRAALDVEHAAALAQQGELDEAAVVAGRAHAALADSKVAQLTALCSAGKRADVRGVARALGAIGDGIFSAAQRGSMLRRAALLAAASGELGQRLSAHDDASVYARSELLGEPELLPERLALAEGDGRVPWLFRLSEAQAARGDLAAASATLGQLLELNPRSLLALDLDRRVRRSAGDAAGYARRTLALGELLVEGERAASILIEAGQAFESLGDVHAAVYAYRETLTRTPFDGAVHARARALLAAEARVVGEDAEARQAWARAALLELYSHRLEHVDDLPEKVGVLVERAELYAGGGDRVRAEVDLRAVLELDPDEPRGLWALVCLLAVDEQRLEETREHAERLGALELDAARQRELHQLVGEVEARPGGDPDRAIVALDAALALDEDLPALRKLARLLSSRRQWQRAIDVRRRLIAKVATDEAALIELEIANVYLDGFADQGAAREAALRALQRDPGSTSAIEMLARQGAPSAWSASALAVLDASLETARVQVADRALRDRGVAQVIVLAGLRGDDELRAVARQLGALHEGRPPEARELAPLRGRPIAEVARAVLRAPLLDSELTLLIAAIAESATKLYPFEAAQRGKLIKVPAKQRDTELGPVVELARLLGVGEMDLELGEGKRVDSDDARVVIGREVLPSLGANAGRFRIARALALYSDRLGVLDRLDDVGIVALVAGCFALLKLSWPKELADLQPAAAVVDERQRAIDKVIGRKERKALIALAPRLATIADPRRFRAAALTSASRAALFITADLAAASSELGMEPASELGRVAISAPFLAARRAWHGEGNR